MVDLDDGNGFVPGPGVAVQAVNAAGDSTPTRILIRAPTMSLGYFRRPDAQAEYFRADAFCPADLFVATSGGGWRFGGREDALVKIRGRWVDLVELEERLAAASPAIAEAAAVTVPDADGVGAIAFFFALRDPAAEATAVAAIEASAGLLPPHQRPHWLSAVSALPRTATGKLLRRKLQEMCEGGV